MKYYCVECDKYYCSYCIKENIVEHNDNHFYFPTLNISKKEFNELKSLVQKYYKKKRKLNELKIDNIIKEIKLQRDRDLLI